MVFLIFFAIFALLNAWVGYRVSTLMRPLCHRRLWQSLPTTWLALMFGTLIIVIAFPKTISQDHHLIPRWFSASIYIWHLLILPLTAIILLLIGIAKRSAQAVRRFTKSAITPAPSAEPTLTRRRMLALSATAIPPLATLALSGVAMKQLGRFRLKQYHLALPGWPKGLDGFSMSVIADIHTGIFTTRQMLDELVERSNNLRADVTLLAGDLINISLSDLPVALDMAMRLDSRYGVYIIQGNHDLIQDEQTFNDVCRARGANLLLDEIATLRPRGIPVQLLGAKWNRSDTPEMAESVRILSAARDPDLFPILLAHHPHTWDYARNHNLPLVISGHTHGGQIMLTDKIGGGPLRFKYWTGLYQKDNSTLTVSNGVGNWFPVRVNAPAEMLKITMHPA